MAGLAAQKAAVASGKTIAETLGRLNLEVSVLTNKPSTLSPNLNLLTAPCQKSQDETHPNTQNS